ncbi:MAG: hypothetical protein MJE66_14005 [Proteobacteria bacterium]|nr:hypothetical protein [Pseudomonadota bacterium]
MGELSLRKRLAFGGVALLFVAVVLELGLQVVAWAVPPAGVVLSPGISKVVPDPVLGERPNPAAPDHDSRGWRNAAALDQADLVAIGDSQTYGDEVARENAWPQQAGESWGRSAYNMALGGYSPVQYRLLMDEALALRPAVLLVGFYSGNDVAGSYRSVYRGRRSPELASKDPAKQSALAAAAEERPSIAAAWQATRVAKKGSARYWFNTWIGDPIEEHGKLFGLFRALGRKLGGNFTGHKTDTVKDDWAKYEARVAGVSRDLMFPFHDGEVGTVLTPAARLAALDLEDPRVAEGLRVSLDALARMHAAAPEGTRVCVVFIPTKELVYAERVAKASGPVPDSYRRLLAQEREVWRRTGQALDEAGVAWVDTLPALRADLARGVNPYLMDWNGHPNVAGNLAIARAVVAGL